MSTLLLTENFPPVIGGTSRWFWEIYRRLRVSEVVIAAGACANDSAFDRTHELHVARLPLTFADLGVFSIAGWARHQRAATAIRKLVRRTGVRRVHCGRVLPEGWLALRCGMPYACFVHGEELRTARTSRQLAWMSDHTLRRATQVLANSRNTARMLREGWSVPESKIRVLYPGVDTRRFVPASPDEAVRAALGWSGRRVVLTVGRLQKRKGHDVLIEALGLIRQQFPDVLYAIVGDGEEKAALGRQVAHAGLGAHVRFHGAVDEVMLVRAYQHCDLFVLPNRTVAGDFEGFGMVLLEAQACGRAVIAGDSGGTVEAVRHDETGLIVDCSRPQFLAATLANLLNDGARCHRMGAAGRQWVERTFNFDATMATTARLLDIPLAQ